MQRLGQGDGEPQRPDTRASGPDLGAPFQAVLQIEVGNAMGNHQLAAPAIQALHIAQQGRQIGTAATDRATTLHDPTAANAATIIDPCYVLLHYQPMLDN
jgi:hypothetical protein